MSKFFRFPHTPHLAWLGAGGPRDDKILSTKEVDELLSGEVAVEEKLDGANLGFSLGADGQLLVQNRGQYLAEPYIGQFGRLPAWLAVHGGTIGDLLEEKQEHRLTLFGEWCAARHSLNYTRLPDWFLLFDIFEAATCRFWSSDRRNALAAKLGLATTPQLTSGHFTLKELTTNVDQWPSQFRDGPLEGIVIRREAEQWCDFRAKLVRGDFTQAIGEHWRHRRLVWNRLAPSGAA